MGHHPHLDPELYTLKDELFFEQLEWVKLQAGGTWKNVVRQARISTRLLRKIRNNDSKVVSYTVVDKVFSRTGFPQLVANFDWYTPDQLVEMGVWRPHSTVGLKRKGQKKSDRRADRAKIK
jgi:hypothetical protein